MRRRTLIWAIIIALISLAVFALIYDGRPLKKPVYHVGQVVEMVMGKDQGIVMKVGRGDGYVYLLGEVLLQESYLPR